MKSTKRLRSCRLRRGSVIIAVMAGSILFLALLALVIDVGSWYCDRVQIQTLADVAVESALRRYPGATAGDASRSFMLSVFHSNGLAPHSLEVTKIGPNVVLRVGVERPRYFSSRPDSHSVDLVVEARARRDGQGRVLLVP
jgi:uncharacterized membrane protein